MVIGSRPISLTGAAGHTPGAMTQLELELQELRRRRRSFGFKAWVRSLRPFDRRAIREPDERDIYWINVQRRLAESDAASLMQRDQPRVPNPGL